MNTTVLTYPDYTDLTSRPLIFLVGPIQGAHNWYDVATDYFIKKTSDTIIALSRNKIQFTGKSNSQMSEEQIDWKTYHLRHAGKFGVIMFWLAKEYEHNPHRAYAQTTRFDLAEWKTRHEYEHVKMVVGVEEGFSGAKYIRRRLSQDCPNIKICSTLEETCDQAINLLK
ncbi:MAG: hypothetical protein ACP5N1_07235 [Candidatus Woesearchaeota archaeon]